MNDMRFNMPQPPLEATTVDAVEEKKEKRFKLNKQKVLFFGAAVLFLAVLGAAIFFFIKVQKLGLQDQAAAAALEAPRIIAEVGELIVLPRDEEPTVATISDVEKLREQEFFRNAKNGDKVLIYAKAGKAILYDPVAKKIVEVAPLNIK